MLVICCVLICSNLSSLVWWRGSFISDNSTGPCSPDIRFDWVCVCVGVYVCVHGVKTGDLFPFCVICSN